MLLAGAGAGDDDATLDGVGGLDGVWALDGDEGRLTTKLGGRTGLSAKKPDMRAALLTNEEEPPKVVLL